MLAGALEALAETYDAAGVRAWTVWVPDEDRETADLLAARGHVLDAAPRAMAMELAGLRADPPRPGRDRAPGRSTALPRPRSTISPTATARTASAPPSPARPRSAGTGRYEGEEPVGCVGAIEVGEDCCVTGVATPPEQRGRGIASGLLCRALPRRASAACATRLAAGDQSRRADLRTARLRDFGFVEMWELRR